MNDYALRVGRRSDARARLAATARRLFHERGYQAVGVAELCSAADVNKGSFYHFFPSKRHLLLEVLSSVWDETGILRTWEQQPPVEPIGEFRRYLRELFAYHYADWEASGQVRGSLLGNVAAELGGHDAEVVTAIRQLFERQRRAFQAMLAAGRESGALDMPDVGATANGLVAAIHGLLTLAKVRNDLSVLPESETVLLRLAGRYS